jgi:hypothetical protein
MGGTSMAFVKVRNTTRVPFAPEPLSSADIALPADAVARIQGCGAHDVKSTYVTGTEFPVAGGMAGLYAASPEGESDFLAFIKS